MRPFLNNALNQSVAALSLLLLASYCAEAQAASVSDDDIRQQMIQESLNSYSGNCPCPYNTMRNGRVCGGNSAYSRPGGYSPLCYSDDISAADVSHYRQSHGLIVPTKSPTRRHAASS